MHMIGAALNPQASAKKSAARKTIAQCKATASKTLTSQSMKKPVAAVADVVKVPDERSLEQLDQQADDENNTVNRAAASALAQTRQKDIAMLYYITTLKALDLVGRENSLREVYIADLDQSGSKTDDISKELLHAMTTCKAKTWLDTKLALLHKCATHIENCDQLISDIKNLTRTSKFGGKRNANTLSEA